MEEPPDLERFATSEPLGAPASTDGAGTDPTIEGVTGRLWSIESCWQGLLVVPHLWSTPSTSRIWAIGAAQGLLWKHQQCTWVHTWTPRAHIPWPFCDPKTRGTPKTTLPTATAGCTPSLHAWILLGHFPTDCQLVGPFQGSSRHSAWETQSSTGAQNRSLQKLNSGESSESVTVVRATLNRLIFWRICARFWMYQFCCSWALVFKSCRGSWDARVLSLLGMTSWSGYSWIQDSPWACQKNCCCDKAVAKDRKNWSNLLRVSSDVHLGPCRSIFPGQLWECDETGGEGSRASRVRMHYTDL